jgi:hypothetical protein
MHTNSLPQNDGTNNTQMFVRRQYKVSNYRVTYDQILRAPDSVVPRTWKVALTHAKTHRLGTGEFHRLMHHVRCNFGILTDENRQRLTHALHREIAEIDALLARTLDWDPSRDTLEARLGELQRVDARIHRLNDAGAV